MCWLSPQSRLLGHRCLYDDDDDDDIVILFFLLDLYRSDLVHSIAYCSSGIVVT